MRDYLLHNALKIVLIGAVLDILAFSMARFVTEFIAPLEYPIHRIQQFGYFMDFVQLIANVFYWLALASVIVFLEALYRSRLKSTD